MKCYGIQMPNTIQRRRKSIEPQWHGRHFIRYSRVQQVERRAERERESERQQVERLLVVRRRSQLSLFLSRQISFLAGEFCFWSCPCQPPSIFPISLSEIESAIYFFVSSDSFSQAIRQSTFSVSSFRIANRTKGRFSSRERKLAAATASIHSTKRLSMRAPRV